MDFIGLTDTTRPEETDLREVPIELPLFGRRIFQDKKIVASDGSEEDSFGKSVAISGDYAIVGAYWDDDNGFNSGAAYIFYRHQGGANNWGEVAKLTAGDGATQDYFVCSVSFYCFLWHVFSWY